MRPIGMNSPMRVTITDPTRTTMIRKAKIFCRFFLDQEKGGSVIAS